MTRLCRNLLASALVLGHLPISLASTTLYVNGVSGSDTSNCMSVQTACKTIGHAVSVASSGDSIRVAAATYTEHLAIGFSLNLIGSGASTTIIDGAYANSVLTISSASADVGISNVTITHGGGQYGAGIYNNGTLTINSSSINGNAASYQCRYGYCGAQGGGIFNTGNGTLTINNSTISGNSASARCTFLSGPCHGANSFGGGIFNGGKLTMNNNTLSGNDVGVSCFPSPLGSRCAAGGGGIASGGTLATLAINNSTISGNSTNAQCNVKPCLAYAGGIYNSGVLYAATIQNSIVSSNAQGNCYVIKSDSYNLSSDGTCHFDNVGDLNNTDPKLGPLQNNGGPTETMALSSVSPAIDAGNPSGCTEGLGHLLKTDQRGMPRPDREDTGGCDMGAYESQSD